MKTNPLLALQECGQSVWMDFLRRGTIHSGELGRWIDEDGLRGVTSNPSIFEKAIAGSHDYDEAVRALALGGKNASQIYETIVVEDIQEAADVFRPSYDRLQGRDGFVSLEVSPRLAHDTEGTIAEARRLWSEVQRPNVMIKVPATRAGLPAIERLIAEGINVNITLLFGLPRYEKVAEAYLAGLEARVAKQQPIDRIASVASFFLSRIDVLLDPRLEKTANEAGPRRETAARLHGEVAVASAKVAYQIYKRIFGTERFRALASKGARVQRLLWASTSTKNPAYSDVKYVEPLIGPDTINTVPVETFDAYRDHGAPAVRLEQGAAEAEQTLRQLGEIGIDLDLATERLENEGVEKFLKSFDKLLATLEERRQAASQEPVDRQSFELRNQQSVVSSSLASLSERQLVVRVWRKDPSVWKTDPADQKTIVNGLGWLHAPQKMEANVSDLEVFAAEVRNAGVRQVVLLGMGGSSLAPLVFQRVFRPAGSPKFDVLDTIDPQSVLSLERRLPLAQTLFIVASKSGKTAEARTLSDYFYERVRQVKGKSAGENFAAITDPGTPLAVLAHERSFRRTFLNFPDIAGRYSALSYFGLVPAALMGLDLSELLVRSLRMLHACASCSPLAESPGARLGAALGELAARGRNKLTFVLPPSLAPLGLWFEHLLAESTGKEGRGIVPVVGEPLGTPESYGEDRLFVRFKLGEEDAAVERDIAALRSSQPFITLQLEDRLDLGQELYRWEFATAVAGAVLGINPFDQPNVEESKANTNRLLQRLRDGGELPEPAAIAAEGPLRYFELQRTNVFDPVAALLSHARAGGYVALQAYLPESAELDHALAAVRVKIRDSLRVATTVGYGPRFLHSTGQLHKGGPAGGLFVQLTARDREDAEVPNQPFSLSQLKRAQVLGDAEALRHRNRPVLRVDLGADPLVGLAALSRAVEEATRPRK